MTDDLTVDELLALCAQHGHRYLTRGPVAGRCARCGRRKLRPVSAIPDVGWKWLKWTIGFWSDPGNCTFFGIDLGPLEIVWRMEGYRP